jgi:hypothetical protein
MVVLPLAPPVHQWRDAPVDRQAESAVVAVWRDLTPHTAQAYACSLLPTIRQARALERSPKRMQATLPRVEVLDEPERYGSWVADRILGHGGDGWALHAVHETTGQEATIKCPARGDGWVWHRLGDDDWHPNLVRVLDGELEDAPWSYRHVWIAREYGDATLAEEMHQRGGRLPLAEALDIFRVCCAAVAWFHERRIYRWSAHIKNILKFGDSWRLVDFGRSVCFVPADHWAVSAQRKMLADHEALWGHPTSAGFWPYHPERERRLRLDDCAMLAGLLCVLVSGKRWRWFFRALDTRPYCSAHYALTGDRDVDKQLSAVLNRAWRGDAGGALLVANDGRGDQSVYEDALELLTDVTNALS